MNQRAPIGQILADLGTISEEQRNGAARHLTDRPTRFASKLLLLKAAPEAALLQGLAAQKGVPGIDLSRSVVDLEATDLVPRQISEESSFLPVKADAEHIHLAMANPNDRRLSDEIAFVTGRKVVAYVSLQAVLRAAIPRAYECRASGDALLAGIAAPSAEAQLAMVLPPNSGMEEEEEEILAISVDLEDEPLDLEEMADSAAASDAAVAALNEGADGEAGGSAETAPTTGSAPLGPRVLVVDDEEEIQNLLATALVKEGYRVETAGRGLEALQKVKAFEPNAVILDAMLPEVHGFEICRKIRSSTRFGHVPVIMISAVYRGWRYAQDVTEVYGATAFIEKPFRLPEVLRHLAAALEGATPAPEANADSRQQASRAYRRGVGLLKVGKIEGAIEAFREGLSADPFSSSLHFSLGRAMQVKGEAFAAITSYEKAVELKPDLYPALKSLSLLYEKQGFRRKAIEHWERALPVAPDAETRGVARDHLLRLLEAPLGPGARPE